MPIDFEAEANAIKNETQGNFYSSPLTQSPNLKSLPSPVVTDYSLNQRSGFGFWNFFGIAVLVLLTTGCVSFIFLLEEGKFQSNISQDVSLEPQINNQYEHIIDNINNHTIQIENKIYVDQIVCNSTT